MIAPDQWRERASTAASRHSQGQVSRGLTPQFGDTVKWISAGHIRVIIVSCVVGIILASCAPAPRLYPVPFERPSPLLRVPGQDPAAALDSLRARLEENGYLTDSVDEPAASILMSRPSASGHEAYDKALIWVERDLDEPLDFIQVYALCGKFITVVGSGEPIRRQWLSPAEEAEQLRTIRDILTP